MEGNACDIDHLDSDVLLPPRKRLLAGLKKQNDDNMEFECDIRLNNLLKFHSDDCNRSIEQIVEASRVAAVEAVKLAKAARAIADEKAAKAAQAMAAAKNAIKLVDTFSGDVVTSRDEYSKKNKTKKHVPVQTLYKGTKSCTTDSSPRISKNSTSDSRNHKHKKLKRSSPSEKAKLQNGSKSSEGNEPSTSNGIKGPNGPSQEKDLSRVDLRSAKFSKADLRKVEKGEPSRSSKEDCLKTENDKGEPTNSKKKLEESPDDTRNIGKKKGSTKRKTLPLTFKDKVNHKKDMKNKRSSSATAI